MNTNQIIKKIESIKEFGGIPRFSAKKHNNRICVCRNNGEFCTNPKWSGRGGWATIEGFYTKDDAVKEFGLLK
jgi:hypothetical protein